MVMRYEDRDPKYGNRVTPHATCSECGYTVWLEDETKPYLISAPPKKCPRCEAASPDEERES